MIEILIGVGVIISSIGLLYVSSFYDPGIVEFPKGRKITFSDRITIGGVNLLMILISGVVILVLYGLGKMVLTII